MKKLLFCLFLFANALLPAADAKVQKGREIQPCEGNGSQAEATGCAHRDYVAADAELNKAYKLFASKLDATAKAGLKQSELNWIKYRDATCEFESAFYKGGTMRPMIEYFCMARMTKARAAELRQQIENYDQ